jgi:hypothetical protein
MVTGTGGVVSGLLSKFRGNRPVVWQEEQIDL